MAQITLTQKVQKFIQFFKKEWLILSILLIGAFLRLYKIDEYMTFLGDEGRDVLIVRNLLVNFDPILIGPGTSVGGMYLGPLYYYFMAPFLLLAGFSPVGPAIGVSILGVATIYLVYIVGKNWFGRKAGIISALLFALSPTVITYSHSSWNPNIMPFFSLLAIYSIWKVYVGHQYRWLIVLAVSFSFVLQSHYLGVLIFPVIFIYWLKSKIPIKYSIYSILVFLFLMSPLLLFDIRHNWINLNALYKFLTVRDEIFAISLQIVIPKIYFIFEQIIGSLLTANDRWTTRIILIIFFAYLFFMYTKKNKPKRRNYAILILWFIFGLAGLGLYKQNIYDHYFGFLFPVPFLLLGVFFADRLDLKNKLMDILIYLMIFYLIFLNLKNNPFMFQPNNQMQRAKNVANKVLEIVNNKPFNLAVLAERNYEDGYRYFMEVAGARVMHADRWDPKTISDTLIVICEMPKETCDPTHSAKAEVANFGMSKIDGEFEVDGVVIYKLIHRK